MKRPWWLIACIILWVLLGGATTFTAMFVAFLFDAPGSADNRFLIDAAAGLVALPLTFFLSAAIAGFLKGPRLRLLALGLPLIPIAFVVYAFVMVSSVCGGQFNCH